MGKKRERERKAECFHFYQLRKDRIILNTQIGLF